MKKLFIIIAVLLLQIGCKPGIPDTIIQPKAMENVLYDMHIAEGYIGAMPTQDSAKKVSAPYYEGVYKKFNIDSTKYQQSLTYYYKNPEVFNEIYKNVLLHLQQTRDSFSKAVSKHPELYKIENLK